MAALTKQQPNLVWDEIAADENPEVYIDTLYSTTSKVDFLARKTEPSDIPQIVKLINDETRQVFPSCDAGKLCEKSAFSLVLDDMNLSRPKALVAHASFSGAPYDVNINMDGRLWKTHDDLKGLNAMNTLFLSFYVSSAEILTEVILQEVLGNAFLACSLVDYIVLETPSLEYNGSFFFSTLCRETVLTMKNKMEKKLLIYNKNVMYPQMKIREGREHDLDDLSPLMNIDTSEMEENFNKSYLNDLIAMSDRNNQSVVAEHHSIAVGMIAVTTDINYNMLNTFFQLEPFHGLYKPHLRDEINLAYRRAQEAYKTCTEDEKKFVKDDYEESLRGSEPNSRTLISASSSSSTFSTTTATASASTSQLNKESRTTTAQDVGGAKTVADIFPNSQQQSDMIIPIIDASNGDVQEQGAQLRHPRLSASEEMMKFPPEVVALHEQLREGKLELDEIEGLDEGLKEMLSQLEEIMDRRELEAKAPTVIHNVAEDICYPMEIYSEQKPVYHGIPNALAIQLCVMDKKYNIRILDLIQGAFLCFPNREYCVITIPCGTPLPFWLEYFVRVVPRKQSLLDRELYVLHRNVFNCRLRVRPGNDRDDQKVGKLLETISAKDRILEDFQRSHNASGYQNDLYSFVALAGPAQQSHIIGLVILSDQENTEHFQINYNTDSYVYADLHEPSESAYVHHFILNPIFRRFSKKILNQVMRYMKKEVLYHCLYSPYRKTTKMNQQSLLNNLDDWHVVPPRPRINYTKLSLNDTYDEDRVPPPESLDCSESYALLLHAKKFTYDIKAELTHRILFVGASGTALSCIEKLITTPKLSFLRLTIVSPHGLPGALKPDEIRNLMFPRTGGPCVSLDSDGEWYDRVGVHLKVNVIYGKVTSILRDHNIAVVNRENVIPYDYIVFAVGQQFVRPDCPEPEIVDPHLNEFIAQSIQQDEKRRDKLRKPLTRYTKKPKNVFVVNSEMDAAVALNYIRTELPSFRKQRILIHGACLEAYCCLSAMLRMGISPERIVFIVGPEFHMSWEERRAFKDTPKLRETMLSVIKSLNIKLLPKHEFSNWFLDSKSNTVTRVNFSAPQESEIVSYSCFAYFGYSQHRISDEFLTSMLDSYITFDKGLSIGLDFKTNDGNIWAAGPCTSYDNKLMAAKYDHPFYNSHEVGQLLADKIIDELDPTKRTYDITKTTQFIPQIPTTLTTPLVYYSELPGGWFYLYCSKPGPCSANCKEDCTCELCEKGIVISTGSTEARVDRSQSYFRLCLSSNFKVMVVECLSRMRFSPWNLSKLYNAHESILHNLVDRFERGEIQCLFNFFEQPWVAALCHDRWSDFKLELSQLYMSCPIDGDLKLRDFIEAYVDNLDNSEALKVDANIIRRVFEVSGLKKRIELKFLNFLRYNRNALPMYARPDLVEKLIKDRRVSPLLAPYITSLYE